METKYTLKIKDSNYAHSVHGRMLLIWIFYIVFMFYNQEIGDNGILIVAGILMFIIYLYVARFIYSFIGYEEVTIDNEKLTIKRKNYFLLSRRKQVYTFKQIVKCTVVDADQHKTRAMGRIAVPSAARLSMHVKIPYHTARYFGSGVDDEKANEIVNLINERIDSSLRLG